MKAELQEIASHFALKAILPQSTRWATDSSTTRSSSARRRGAGLYPPTQKQKHLPRCAGHDGEHPQSVTEHIRRRVIAEGGDPTREAMTVILTHDGKLYHIDPSGEYWAVTVFIADTIAYNKADSRNSPARAVRVSASSRRNWPTSPNRSPKRSRDSTTSATASCSGMRPAAQRRRPREGSSDGDRLDRVAPHRNARSGRRSRRARSRRA